MLREYIGVSVSYFLPFYFSYRNTLILLHFNPQQATLKGRNTWFCSWGFSFFPLGSHSPLKNTAASIPNILAMCSNAWFHIIGPVPRGLGFFVCLLFLIHCQTNPWSWCNTQLILAFKHIWGIDKLINMPRPWNV